MARQCTICAHPQREAIDRALVGAMRDSKICAEWRVSRHALAPHRDTHLPAHLVRSQRATQVTNANDLVQRLEHVARETMAILHEARHGDAPDNALALRAASRIERQVAMQVRVLAELRAETLPKGAGGADAALARWRVEAALDKAMKLHPRAIVALSGVKLELRNCVPMRAGGAGPD